ncbi:MAG: acetylglutamate kinase [Planctomycetes bacterium]|nr:acetylglutamate kinase [Planctomycetota bacterium]MCC7398267.1 acetylglutamate kinase [Planctomycetota bacterium]
MRILLKIGGAQLEEASPRAALSAAIAAARQAGHELIVVHGGGNQIRSVGKAMGLGDRYHDGLRITDAKTAEVVLMVLGGLVNRTLVASLQQAGVMAVGLSGADGRLFTAKPLERAGVDLGFVGEVDQVCPFVVDSLLAAGITPVIATVAPGSTALAPGAAAAPFFNLNADHAAGPLSKALGCDAMLFLTDVPAVLGADKAPLPLLTPADCERLVHDRIATGGMLPKLEAALLALRNNPSALVKIAPAGAADAVLHALRADTGTRFVMERTPQLETRHG